MIQDRLKLELEYLADRYRRLFYWQVLAAVWLVAAVIVLACGGLQLNIWGMSQVVLMSLVGCLAACAAVIWRLVISAPSHLTVARRVEAMFPELDSCLLAALEQTPALPNGQYGFLQQAVIAEAVAHAETYSWSKVVSKRRLALSVVTQYVTLGLFLTTLVISLPAVKTMLAKKGKKPAAATGGEFSVTVEPGNTEIERGASLLVLARVKGPMPAEATLIYGSPSGESTQLAMSASLDDPIFGGRVSTVTQPLSYHVKLGDHVSPTYQVTVFEYPRLERADARLVYPGYTGLEERLVQDIRTLSVVEGTEINLICQLNKPVKSAVLVENAASKPSDKTPPAYGADKAAGTSSPAADQPLPDLPLTLRDGNVYEVKFRAEKTRRLKLQLVDDAGRKNVDPSPIVIQVVPNLPPTFKLAFPGRDLEVSPLEELDLRATVWDDFGVRRMGVNYGMADREAQDVVLGENAAARQKHEVKNLIRFEELKAEPDQLLSYYFWAEDIDSDGKVRRTFSDMYFADVRHFDEIFRQGQQPPGGQQQQRQQQQGNQNSQTAQQLAQLQKDIINATWKLIRRETAAKPSAAFASDIDQISQSQVAALEQATELGESVQDSEAQSHLLAVLAAMQQAVKQLKAAHDGPSLAELQLALAAEQASYQALLKLRAREHEVSRQQQSQSSSSNSQTARSQQQRQQMQQLDVSNEENRYEAQRLAQSQQERPEDRETKQVLNRLKELARRQHDLNERLKDLQSALQEAATEEKKEEIRQQLKRLQDEQRDVLRDTDELQSRMDTPENQEQMAEERQKLEQARAQVQRASESLEGEKVTQAAASGTRAEKEFEELRNEFRKRASGQFNDQMREMRDAARDLDQQEKKLAEKLAATTNTDQQKKSLRDDESNQSGAIADSLNQQKERLNTLTERLKKTVEEAEQTEPLLTEKLADAARNLQDQNVERALDVAGRSARQGLLEDAREVEKVAGRGISQLREGIEKAAESVLGDETEALRRAREQLRNLAQELNQEIARNVPEEKLPTDPNQEAAAGTSGQTGEQNNGEAKPKANGDPMADPNAERRRGNGGDRQPPAANRPTAEGQGSERPERQPSGEPRPGGSREGQREPGETPQGGQQPGPGERQPGQDGMPPDGDRPQNGAQGENSLMPEGERQGGGQQPGQQAGQQAGQRPGHQPGQNGQGTPTGQRGQQSGQNQQRGQRGGQPRANQAGLGGGLTEEGSEETNSPIAGDDFLDWSDRLRDVEEMVDDPELRAEAARIRDQARSIRAEVKRHSKAPNWKLVRANVSEPLVELTNRISNELLRRNSKQAIVPLDRDPVPPKYSEKTRRYYEQLGTGK